MSRDYGEMEREFLSTLAAETGRDLSGWMIAIDGQSYGHRNELIDWLRQQGFTFSKASWMERIHHNGGRPVYGSKPAAKTRDEVNREATAHSKKDAAVAMASPVPMTQPTPASSPAVDPVPGPVALASAPTPLDDPGLSAFLQKAKGYRPLADLLLRQVRIAAPNTVFVVHGTHITMGSPAVYGALSLTSKDIRLALDLGDQAFADDLRPVRIPGQPSNLTHTIVLNDARRINQELMQLVIVSSQRANG
jgi:hypothetical protein